MDKRKLLFILIVFLLLASACYGQDEAEEELSEVSLFDEWVVEGSTFQVSGLDVFVSAGSAGEGIFIFPQKTLMLVENKCEMVDRLKVCMLGWEYLIGGTVEIHGEDQQKFHVVVTVPAPDVAISREAAETDLEVGESTRVTITLRNDGTEPALGVKYTETLPPEFEITMTNNVERQFNKIVWQGSIPKGGEAKFAYNIKAKSGFSGSIPAVLEYNVHGVPRKLSDSLNIEVTSLINIGQKLDSPHTQYGEENRFYVTVGNKRGEEMTADVRVTVPEGLYVVATHFNQSKGNTYMWSGTVEGSGSNTFITRFRADEPGTQKVNVSVSAVFTDSKQASVQEDIEIEVEVKEAELYFIPKKLKRGEQSKVKVYMKNPNTYAEFKDVDVSASSDYFNGSIHLKKYKVAEYNEVLSFDILQNETGKFTAKAQAAYLIGSTKYTVKKEEKIEVQEQEVPEEEKIPPKNETEGNKTEVNKTEPQKTEEPEKEKKELFVVGFVRRVIDRVVDSVRTLLEIRKGLKG